MSAESAVVTGSAARDRGRADRAGVGGQDRFSTRFPRLMSWIQLDDPSLGPLAELVLDPAVSDVLVNGPFEVWVDRGHGLEPRPQVHFADAAQLRGVAQRLASACGRRLDDATPYVDAQLPDGTRLHAVLAPLAVRGPYLSLRTLRRQSLTIADLIHVDTLTPDSAELVEAIVRARLAFVVTGGTGSGKTTLLGALLSLVPPNERIVIVEDATELCPDHPHVVSLQARLSNVEGAGAIGLRDLVRVALRMRPDRLVVGECRGGEVIDWLGSLNTGHEGGAGTLHANGVAEVPARFEALGLLVGIPREAVAAQVGAGLQLVLSLVRRGAVRSLHEVGLLRRSGNEVLPQTVWHRTHGVGPAGPALALMLAERGVPVPGALRRHP